MTDAVPVDIKAVEQVNSESLMDGVAADLKPLLDYVGGLLHEVSSQLLSVEGILQIIVILCTGALSWIASKPARRMFDKQAMSSSSERQLLTTFAQVGSQLIQPMFWVVLLWISSAAFRELETGNDLIRIVASLLQAWILIRLFSTFVRDPSWATAFARVAWVIAALNILRLLNPVIDILDGFAITIGAARLSLYIIIKGVLLLVILLWAVSLVANLVKSRLASSRSLTPSVQTLIAQTVRIFLLFLAVIFAMNTIGIDLTALHVFSGAIGVGIGFGLQAIFSNLVAGVILLLERSIKIGDYVELESGVTGEVREISIRSTRITTNDNVDILVPNAEFINTRVTNWTLRDAYRRIRIPFGVAYGTDKNLVRKAVLEAANSQPHMLEGTNAKEPQVWLTGFGDSSLDFELVIWLSPEAVKRPSAVAADYNWAIETALSKYNIEIPFPQRDIHIRAGNLPVMLATESPPPEKPTTT